MSRPLISVIIPVYGKELNLEELYSRLCSSLSPITEDFEILLINDCSPDDAWGVIKKLASTDKRVRGVNFSKNFGQHYALTAGLEYSAGVWCVLMDCDLQDQPEEIVKFYEEAQKGFDMVVGKRSVRRDSLVKRFTSWAFYIVFNYLTDQKLDNSVANFGIYSRKVVDSILKYKEHDRSVGLLLTLVGFRRSEIDIEHAARQIGVTGYSFRMRLRLAEDHILSHSTKPIRLAAKLGFSMTLLSFVYALVLLVRYFISGTEIPGWYSLTLSLFFLSGSIMFLIGLVGLYVSRIYQEVKFRPLYIVESTTFD
jgi:dolichol-phosphate mannosyltransferase